MQIPIPVKLLLQKTSWKMGWEQLYMPELRFKNTDKIANLQGIIAFRNARKIKNKAGR